MILISSTGVWRFAHVGKYYARKEWTSNVAKLRQPIHRRTACQRTSSVSSGFWLERVVTVDTLFFSDQLWTDYSGGHHGLGFPRKPVGIVNRKKLQPDTMAKRPPVILEKHLFPSQSKLPF